MQGREYEGYITDLLTQTIKSLLFATVYIDENGQTRVRTRSGISSAPLGVGDTVLREEQRLVNNVLRIVVIVQTSAGTTYAIDENGNRT